MKKLIPSLMLLVMVAMSSCSVAIGIFKTGAAIIAILAVIAVIFGLISMYSSEN